MSIIILISISGAIWWLIRDEKRIEADAQDVFTFICSDPDCPHCKYDENL